MDPGKLSYDSRSRLGQMFAKLYNKLENYGHHRRAEEGLSTSLKAFRSQVSKLIDELGSNSKPESKILSLSWIQKCLGILPLINKAFEKLTLEIDYPMSRWEVDSIDEYLSYSLCLLDLFNSISYSFSHLEKAKLSLIHALKLFENENSTSLTTIHHHHHHHLKATQLSCLNTKFDEKLCKKNDKVKFFNGKKLVVNEGVKELKRIGFWVCGILLSGLCGDVRPYIEVKKMVGGFDGSLIFRLDSTISEGLGEKIFVLKEVKEVNDAVDCFLEASDEVKHDAAKELETKLNKLVEVSDVLKAEVNDLFSKVMALRIDLIDQLRKQY